MGQFRFVMRFNRASPTLLSACASGKQFTAALLTCRRDDAAAEEFLAANGLKWSDVDLIGMHGQTVLHERPQEGRVGRTVQLGDAGLLARKSGVPVAHDFRTADVAAGGEGAPLAPIYHLARAVASGLNAPTRTLRNVVLPAPFGPTMPTASFWRIVKFTPSRTVSASTR